MARRILENFRNPHKTTVEVVLMGSSHFRQIWESLVCSYRDQMSDFWIQNNIRTLTIDLDSILNGTCHTRLPANPTTRSSIGTGRSSHKTTCSATTTWPGQNSRMEREARFDFPQFFDRGHTKTSRYPSKSWAFLSSRTKSTPWTLSFGSPRTAARDTGSTAEMRTLDCCTKISLTCGLPPGSPGTTCKTSTENARPARDLGRWFGADNPWITWPPDRNHGCMPGMPDDDEVNILLWYMLSLSAMNA